MAKAICPACGSPAKSLKTQRIMGDLTCCGEKYNAKVPCKQNGHKNYICSKHGGLIFTKYGR